jgi:hypothetical protein
MAKMDAEEDEFKHELTETQRLNTGGDLDAPRDGDGGQPRHDGWIDNLGARVKEQRHKDLLCGGGRVCS